MRLICQSCEGEGQILDPAGHKELCPECMGLGYREVEEKDETAVFLRKRKPVMNAVYTLTVIMAAFYVTYLLADHFYNLSLTTALIILLTGHLAGVGGFFIYLLSGILKEKESF